MIRLALLLVLLGCAPAPSFAAETDDKDIRAVIESFRTAILQKDRARFLGLFVSPDVPWQGVLTDDGLAELKHLDSKAVKVAFDHRSTPAAFIDSISRTKKTSEQKFTNIKVDTDGDVATATADYDFLSGDRIVNSGKECWLLVRGGAGWKITTLAFSSNLTKDGAKH